MTSPPLQVPRALQTDKLIVVLMNRTLPSGMDWWLKPVSWIH